MLTGPWSYGEKSVIRRCPPNRRTFPIVQTATAARPTSAYIPMTAQEADDYDKRRFRDR